MSCSNNTEKRSIDTAILESLAYLVDSGERHITVYRLSKVAGVERSLIYRRLKRYLQK